MKKQQMIIAIETNPELTLEELCSTCNVTRDFIQELIEYGIIDLENKFMEEFRFNPAHLQRIRTVIHLQNDLEINLPGAALVVDLLDEMDEMRSQINLLEKHIYFTVSK